MIISLPDIIYISLSAITFALYMVLIKKTPRDRYLVTLFWTHAFAYGIYVTIYLFRKFVLEHDVSAIEQFLHEYTYINAPLYFMFAVCSLWSTIIFRNLLKEFDISLIVPFSQISLLFTYLGVTLLGDPFSWQECAGIITIVGGAALTATSNFKITSPQQLFTTLPPKLVRGVTMEALLKAAMIVIVFLITQNTPINEQIIGSLGHIFPFAQYETFYANLGTRFFSILLFYWYLHHNKSYRNLVMPTLHEHWLSLILLSIVYFASTMTYQLAYFLTADKGMLAALSKINVPLLLFFASVLLKEKITPEKIIGSAIVILGGIIVLYAQ